MQVVYSLIKYPLCFRFNEDGYIKIIHRQTIKVNLRFHNLHSDEL